MTVFVNIDFNAADNTHIPLPPTATDAPTKVIATKSHKMPKKKSKPAQNLPLVSDYETDTAQATYSSAAPPVQPLSNDQLNHLAVSRWSPNLQTILAISPFAVLYHFNAESENWEKSDYQGSLFVCALNDGAYEILILNRKNPENLHLPITSSEDIQVTEEFVIMNVPDGQPVGLWMYSDEQMAPEKRVEAIAAKIIECAQQAEANTVLDEEEEYDDAVQGTDGFVESQQYVEQTPAPASESMRGQSIDLATLFGKSRQSQVEEPQPVQQQPQLPPQQGSLLDLFKNAKRA